MTIEVINSGESGAVVRGKINNNFADTIVGETLDPASPMNGTEGVFMLQGGLPKLGTSEQLVSSPITQTQGYNRQIIKSFSNFIHTSATFSGVNGELFGNEPIICHLANGGTVSQGTGLNYFFRIGSAICATTTNAAGRAGVTSTIPLSTDTSSGKLYIGAYLGTSIVPPLGAVNQATYFGMFPTPGAAAPTSGLYFLASNASANWRAISNNAGAITNQDTGVAITSLGQFNQYLKTLELIYDFEVGSAKYYIDGTLVHTQDDSINFPAVAAYVAGAFTHNLGAVTSNILQIDALNVEYGLIAGTLGMGTGML